MSGAPASRGCDVPGIGEFAWEPTPEKAMPFNPFSALTSKILAGVSLALLIACGIQTLRANHYASKARNCAIERENDRKSYALAQVQAAIAQEALNSSIQARYEAAAKDSAREYQKALSDARGASERYIDRMRIKASGGASGRTDSPAQGGDPGAPADPASETIMVAVRAEDIRDCSVDYSYGRGAYDFLQGLIADGLAIPDTAFGGK